MDIQFQSRKFQRECAEQKKLVKKHGSVRARKIRQRLDDLFAAVVLEDTRKLPGRCHELKGDRAGQLSMDLDHPYRLIFEPANDPIPRKEDGGLDWMKISAIVIIGVEDTHA